eukprot:c37190_g1_i1 orf=39-239(+)
MSLPVDQPSAQAKHIIRLWGGGVQAHISSNIELSDPLELLDPLCLELCLRGSGLLVPWLSPNYLCM